MHEFAIFFKVLKFGAVGVIAVILGIWQISNGDRQGIVGGLGALVAGAAILGAIGWALLHKVGAENTDSKQSNDAQKQTRLLWLGIGTLMLPGLLHLYLRAAEPRRFADNLDLTSALFLSSPFLASGIICLGMYFWSLRPKNNVK